MAFSSFAKTESFGSYASGIGVIKVNPNDETQMMVVFESGEKFKFTDKQLPKFPSKVEPEKEYYVVLVLETDSQGEKTTKVERVDSLRPSKWRDELFLVVDVTRTKDDMNLPTFYEKPSKFDEEKKVKQTNWMFEFQEGEFQGVLVPYNVHYRFQNNEGLAGWDFTEYAFNLKNATRIHQCVEFYVEQMKVLSDVMPIEWADDGNIVPELLARILDKKQYLRASGKGGWIISDTIETVDVSDSKNDPPSFDEVLKEEEVEEDNDNWDDF